MEPVNELLKSANKSVEADGLPLKSKVPETQSLAAKSYLFDDVPCFDAACRDISATLCRSWYCVAVCQDWKVQSIMCVLSQRAARTCNLVPSCNIGRKACAPNAPIATPANCCDEKQMDGEGYQREIAVPENPKTDAEKLMLNPDITSAGF